MVFSGICLCMWSSIRQIDIDCKQTSIIGLAFSRPRPITGNTGNSPYAVSMLAQRRRRWASIDTALGECLVFAGSTDLGGSIAERGPILLYMPSHNADKRKKYSAFKKIIF